MVDTTTKAARVSPPHHVERSAPVKRTHLRGKRGQAFADKIRGIPFDRILCVSLDIHKYFHVVMIHNALGEIVTPTFEIDIFQTGFDRLCQTVDEAIARTTAQVVLTGMEPTGHYFENLARHLLARPQPVTLVNSFSVKLNRSQQMMCREKDDNIDTASIGDLLRRGEGTPFRPAQGIYLQLQQLDRVRLPKVKMRTMLQNQIIGHLDRVFPGLILIGSAAKERYDPLFATSLWGCKTLQHLIQVCPNPRELAKMSPQMLIEAFKTQEYDLSRAKAARIVAYAKKTLLPDPDLLAIRCELLHYDLELLEEIERHAAQLEERLCTLLRETPYWIWTKIKGLSDIQVASLAAAIGDPANYDHAAQVFRRSGLVPGRNDSGIRQREGEGKSITKVGDVYLRRALTNATFTLTSHQPVLDRYYNHLKRSKPTGVARVATVRRAIGILWAILRDGHSDSLILNRGASM
jgi:transposase